MSQVYFYPPATASNPSIGSNGALAPTSSTQVAGENPSGNLSPLQTDASGNLLVSLASDPLGPLDVHITSPLGSQLKAASVSVAVASDQTVPVSAVSLPLPAGASTSALQTSGNASLSSIDGKLPPIGQHDLASSVSVAIATDQGPVPVSASSLPLPTGAATSSLQTSGNASLSSIDGKMASLGQKSMAGSMPVAIASDQSTLAVSAVSLPLPSGAATAANQATEIASLSSIDGKLGSLGQKAMAGSAPVVIASDQSTLPVSASALPLPSGAATSALQTSGNASLSSIDSKTPALGQALAAASVPVVLTAAQITTLTPLTTVNAKAATPTAGTVTQAAITVGTSAVRLTVSGSAPSSTRSVLVATPDSASVASFYIGSASVTNSGATRGVLILAGQSFIANSDAGDYYIVSSSAGQTVFVTEQA